MKYIFAFLLMALASFSFAHGYLASSTPTDGALLSEVPTEMVLEFKEDIEINFSIFKIYPLPTDMQSAESTETEDTEGTEPTEEHSESTEHAEGEEHAEEGEHHDESTEHDTMDAAAQAFIPTVLELTGDEDARVDTGVLSEGTGKTITLALKEGLALGAYVVMWRVLSTDTHTVDGFITFEVSPE